MCSCEWPGRLKCLATGLDRSDPLFLTYLNPWLETTLFIINQSRATRKWRDLTCYAWCYKKLDSGYKALAVANLLLGTLRN